VKLPFPKEKGEFEVRIEQRKKGVVVKKKGQKAPLNKTLPNYYTKFSSYAEKKTANQLLNLIIQKELRN
jgi:hypothetical protein